MCVGFGAFSLILGLFQRLLPPFESLAAFVSSMSTPSESESESDEIADGKVVGNGDALGEDFLYIENEALRNQRLMMEGTQRHHDEL